MGIGGLEILKGDDTDTLTRTEIDVVTLDDVAPYVEDGDPNHLTHIINPPDNPHISNGHPNMEGKDVVAIARLGRIPIKALCGFEFVPERNPENYDSCQACFLVAEQIMKEMGE